MMMGSDSRGSGVVLTKIFDDLFAFCLETLGELRMGVGSPELEDRRLLRAFCGSGDSIEPRRAPSLSSARGIFKDDIPVSSGESSSMIISDSGVKRLPALRAALVTAR